MYLPEFTLSVLKQVTATRDVQDEKFSPREGITALLNPADGPRRLVGLPYTDAVTEEALAALVEEWQADHTSPQSFWLLLLFTCSFAEELPVQKEDVERARHFIEGV